MLLTLKDNSIVEIKLDQNPVSEYIEKSFRHLQHLPIPFHIFDHLTYYKKDKELLYSTLVDSAKKLNINVDVSQLTNQTYLNSLHKIYELGYNKGSNIWLEFHEMIHAIESITNTDTHPIPNEMIINFRDLAGPLEKPFDRNYLEYAVQLVTKGTCFCRWGELGKIPSQYWLDNEPDDTQRLCQLAKPWTVLRPSFVIALDDIDFSLSSDQQQKFNSWFDKHKQIWIQYWKLSSWTESEMYSVIPIGKVNNLSSLIDKVQSGIFPIKVSV
jgi:hypothetical protein